MQLLKRFHWSFFLKKRYLGGLTVLFMVVVIMEIWATNNLATYGEQLTRIEENKASLVLENQLLENEIARSSAIAKIEEEAPRFGLQRAKKIEVLNDGTIAQK